MLLSSQEFRDALQLRLSAASDRVIILSAFLKLDALNWLIDNLDIENISIVSRWRFGDLISGATDLACYQVCKEYKIDFGISLGLHGKVYCVDNHILVGSANATSSGLALRGNYNEEFGYGFIAGNTDRLKLDRYLSNVVWLDDRLFEKISAELIDFERASVGGKSAWSQELTSKLKMSDEHLWAHELPFLTPNKLINVGAGEKNSLQHDLQLLGIPKNAISLESLAQAFRQTRSFSWLYNILDKEGSLSFGGLTAALHNSLLDDPCPYRRDVKQLVSNLFFWAENDPEIFGVSQPRHSKVIKLLRLDHS